MEKARQNDRRRPWQASIVGTYGCIKAQSETDMTEDLKKVDVPKLIVHGEEGQLVPIADTAMLTAKIIRKSTLKIYPGTPHGLTVTFGDKIKQDLLSFLKTKFVRRLADMCCVGRRRACRHAGIGCSGSKC